ncbi:MAG: phage tail sheath protein FI [Crocinitomicaceae bacterium]|jgi:phage tail sheath protein FI
MATLKTPGVYVQEITKFPPSVAPVATAIPAFIGYTEKAEDIVADDLRNISKRITSLLDYETYFGTAQDEDSIAVNVTADDKIIVTNATPSLYKMYYSIQMYFANGGGPCYITSVGSYTDSITLGSLEDGLAAVKKEDEPTLLLFPDATSLSSLDFHAINTSALTQCNQLQDRFTIMDTHTDASTAIDDLRNGISLGKDYLKYGAAYYPFLDTILDYIYKDIDVDVTDETVLSSSVEAQALSDTIDTADLTTLVTALIANRDAVEAAGDLATAQAARPAAAATIQGIIAYLEKLEATLLAILSIGEAESAATTSIALAAWIKTNVTDKITSLEERLDKLNGAASQNVMVNALSGTVGNNVYFFLEFSGATPPVAPAPSINVSTEFDIISDIDNVVLAAGEVFVLIDAIDASPGFTSSTLDQLETINNPLYNRIKTAIGAVPITLPPSSAMAGIYARVDNNVGVWKAPANVGVSYVVKPTVQISQEEQGDMNVTSSGKSVNAIRTFTGKGTLVWGARTLAGNDNEWRYVPVRRFFNFVEESVSEASEQFVFEPNDGNTWVRIRGMIENFLTQQWKAGALAGAKPSQAFYVRVGLGSTMTAQDILEGRMIIEIGMAAVRPAEFIVLRFSHKMQES